MQAVELLVCQPDQIIQRQPLGEFAEPVAGAGADQRIEIAPVVRQLRRLCNLLPQRLLLLTALCVLPELLADLTLAGSVIRSRWPGRAAGFAGWGRQRPPLADAAPGAPHIAGSPARRARPPAEAAAPASVLTASAAGRSRHPAARRGTPPNR